MRTIGWLAALWVVLWRDLSVANVVSGVVVGGLIELSQPTVRHGLERHRVRPLALLSFLGYFGLQLLRANLVLAREVVTPRNRISPGIIAVPLEVSSALVVTLIANVISLTPGTLTLDVRHQGSPTLYVHVLHLHDIDRARADLAELTRRANAALPAKEAEHP